MADQPAGATPSTTDAAKAVAQSQEGLPLEPPTLGPRAPYPGEGTAYLIGAGVRRAAYALPYERDPDDPVYRPLRIYTLDPTAGRLEGSVALVNVPYEPLRPGPQGHVFEVEAHDDWRNLDYQKVDLDDPKVLIRNGRDPSPSDPLFHQQMVYAVCNLVYAVFRQALGRHIAWGFDVADDAPELCARLRIRPHAEKAENAYYDPERGELAFGYYQARPVVGGRNVPGGPVFTCLSHDVIAHEVTHALLDGLRAHFDQPSGPDVIAFHEAFADIVAVFQHFSYHEVVRAALRAAHGQLEKASLLTDLARQFGHTATTGVAGSERPLRSAIDVTDQAERPWRYDVSVEPHRRGESLLSAVFDAFNTVFKRKTERYIRLATNGSGILPPGELSGDLQDVLAAQASSLASQFLSICIRAVDYCPPIDIEFGEFLRAVITADRDLVPDDPWAYREAWIDAFRRRGIYAPKVSSLSEDALLWRPPPRPVRQIKELTFAKLQFQGDPARPAGTRELRRQACALAQVVSDPALLDIFGFARSDDRRLGKDVLYPPCVQSIRSTRRVGPDGQIVFDLVAEVTQRRVVCGGSGATPFDFYGGATVIIDPTGKIRYVISKSVLNEQRLASQRDYVSGGGKKYWVEDNGKRVPVRNLFRLVHDSATRERNAGAVLPSAR